MGHIVRDLDSVNAVCVYIASTVNGAWMYQEPAMLLSRAKAMYLVDYGETQVGGQVPELLVQAPKFSVGCASVFAIVSMAARAISIIDFMVDSIL